MRIPSRRMSLFCRMSCNNNRLPSHQHATIFYSLCIIVCRLRSDLWPNISQISPSTDPPVRRRKRDAKGVEGAGNGEWVIFPLNPLVDLGDRRKLPKRGRKQFECFLSTTKRTPSQCFYSAPQTLYMYMLRQIRPSVCPSHSGNVSIEGQQRI